MCTAWRITIALKILIKWLAEGARTGTRSQQDDSDSNSTPGTGSSLTKCVPQGPRSSCCRYVALEVADPAMCHTHTHTLDTEQCRKGCASLTYSVKEIKRSKCSLRLSIGSCYLLGIAIQDARKPRHFDPENPRHIAWFKTEHDLWLRVDDVTGMISGSGPVHLKQVHEDDQSSLPSCIYSFVECGRMQEPHSPAARIGPFLLLTPTL